MFIGNNFFARFFFFVLWLFFASFFVFALFQTLPSDAATVILGLNASPETLAAFRLDLRLDDGFFTLYFRWIRDILDGNFGSSYTYQIPVLDLILERLPLSLYLAFFSLLLSSMIAIPAGLVMAWHHHSYFDKYLNMIFLIFLAIPTFWCAMLLALFFSVKWKIFSVSGWGSSMPIFSLFLPALALALPQIAIMSRFTRIQTLSILRKPFIFAALGKGCNHQRILWNHIFRNIAAPLLTLSGLQFAFLFSGAIVVESIFALPGIGNLAVQSLLQRDIASLRAVLLIFVILLLSLNFFTDQLHRIIDPRPAKDQL